MSDKLLPCPFCGSSKIDGIFIRDGWSVGCLECTATVRAYHPGAHKKAADLWNRRTPHPADEGSET